LRTIGSSLADIALAGVADDAGRAAGDDGVIGHVAGHDGARADDGAPRRCADQGESSRWTR
jgi:hypothetical protein